MSPWLIAGHPVSLPLTEVSLRDALRQHGQPDEDPGPGNDPMGQAAAATAVARPSSTCDASTAVDRSARLAFNCTVPTLEFNCAKAADDARAITTAKNVSLFFIAFKSPPHLTKYGNNQLSEQPISNSQRNPNRVAPDLNSNIAVN